MDEPLHLVLAQRHCKEENETTLKPTFLLGTVTPDVVTTRSAKRQSHFAQTVLGYVVGYDIKAFEASTAPLRQTSIEHKAFFEGYCYHLVLDRLWLKHCLSRAFFRGVWGKLRGLEHAKVAQYYRDMSDFDAYYNAQIDSGEVEIALDTLAKADRRLLSAPLESKEVDSILAHLAEANTRTSAIFIPLYFRKAEIEAFMQAVKRLEPQRQ